MSSMFKVQKTGSTRSNSHLHKLCYTTIVLYIIHISDREKEREWLREWKLCTYLYFLTTPCNTCSLANSLQSSFKCITIFVPLLTPLASAISYSPSPADVQMLPECAEFYIFMYTCALIRSCAHEWMKIVYANPTVDPFICLHVRSIIHTKVYSNTFLRPHFTFYVFPYLTQ